MFSRQCSAMEVRDGSSPWEPESNIKFSGMLRITHRNQWLLLSYVFRSDNSVRGLFAFMPNDIRALLKCDDCFKRSLWCCFPHYQAVRGHLLL